MEVQAIFLEGKEPISHSTTHDNCQVMSVMETNTLHPSWFLVCFWLLLLLLLSIRESPFLRKTESQDLVLFRGEENMEQF